MAQILVLKTNVMRMAAWHHFVIATRNSHSLWLIIAFVGLAEPPKTPIA